MPLSLLGTVAPSGSGSFVAPPTVVRVVEERPDYVATSDQFRQVVVSHMLDTTTTTSLTCRFVPHKDIGAEIHWSVIDAAKEVFKENGLTWESGKRYRLTEAAISAIVERAKLKFISRAQAAYGRAIIDGTVRWVDPRCSS